jgi:hypothetical protein
MRLVSDYISVRYKCRLCGPARPFPYAECPDNGQRRPAPGLTGIAMTGLRRWAALFTRFRTGSRRCRLASSRPSGRRALKCPSGLAAFAAETAAHNIFPQFFARGSHVARLRLGQRLFSMTQTNPVRFPANSTACNCMAQGGSVPDASKARFAQPSPRRRRRPASPQPLIGSSTRCTITQRCVATTGPDVVNTKREVATASPSQRCDAGAIATGCQSS